MDRGVISRRYASALWMYASKSGQEDKVYAETLVLSKSYVQYESLRRVLSNRTLPQSKKVEIIAALSGQDVSKVFKKFIEVILKTQREEFLRDICWSFQNIYRTEKKLLNVNLTTATAASMETQKAMVEKLEQRTGQTVSLNAKIDPSIVGGYILRVGTYRLDLSVKTQLQRIKKRLVSDVV